MDAFRLLKPNPLEKPRGYGENAHRGKVIKSKTFQEIQPLVARLNEAQKETCRELLKEEGVEVTVGQVPFFFANPLLGDDILLLFQSVFANGFGIF